MDRGVRIRERNNTEDTKVSEEEGGGAPGTRTAIPLQPMKTMMRQAVPLQPMEVNGGADVHLQTMETPRWQRWMCLKEAVTLWRVQAGAGF